MSPPFPLPFQTIHKKKICYVLFEQAKVYLENIKVYEQKTKKRNIKIGRRLLLDTRIRSIRLTGSLFMIGAYIQHISYHE